MGKYYTEETVWSELELSRTRAKSTEHYIKILENEVHRLMQVREELLEFRDAIADAVNVHGQCNQAILDEVRRIAYLFSLIDSDNDDKVSE